MGEKTWTIYLEDGFELLVRRRSFFGLLRSFAVVLVHEDQCITRYDTAHEAPHRDVLGIKNGLIKKDWCANMSYKEAFEHAINDLSEHYRRYYAYFISH